MNTQAKYESIKRINKQLLEYASCRPSWHRQLHGDKELHETMQLAKQLLAQTEYELSLEEAERLELYFAGDNDSLSLENIK